jgi:hypothetical protein
VGAGLYYDIYECFYIYVIVNRIIVSSVCNMTLFLLRDEADEKERSEILYYNNVKDKRKDGSQRNNKKKNIKKMSKE